MQIIQCSSYNNLSLHNIPEAFWTGFPYTKGKTVFIKPNLVNPITNWDKCSTTRVEVVELIIQKLFTQETKQIIVGECGFKDQWDATIHSTRYYRLVNKYNVDLIPLQDGANFHKFTLKRLKEYRSLYGVKFSDYMLKCDVIINVPKMKVHGMAGMTGAIKNMMGTMTQKGSMHPRANCHILHQRLADLYLLTSPMVQFIVMDGIIGAEYSEQCGRPVSSNVLISGTNQWEIDVAASKLMGIDPDEVMYLKYINADFNSVQVPRNLIKHYERPI